jgi:hypothetical protein
MAFRSPVTVTVSRADFGLPSPHLKIPFPAGELDGLNPLGTSEPWEVKPGLIIGVQSERLELLSPFGWGIAQTFDPDASRQPTFDRCPNQVRCEEC